jgi:hypothetical protein
MKIKVANEGNIKVISEANKKVIRRLSTQPGQICMEEVKQRISTSKLS